MRTATTLFVFATVAVAQLQAIEWTADSGNFSDGANWSTGNVPGQFDTVEIINGGEATVETDISVANVRMACCI